MADIKQSEKKRQFRIVLLIFLAIGCCILVASFYFFGNEQAPSSSVSQAKSNRVTGAAGGAGSEAYNEKVKEHDEAEASSALKEGESFVPTPIGDKKPLVSKADTPPAPLATQPVRPPVANTYTPPPVKKGEDPRVRIMMEDLKLLDEKLATSRGQGTISFCAEPEEAPAFQNSSIPTVSDLPVLDIRPGDLLYAVIDTGVNSDVPSAVMATVAGGKFAKTRLLGQFKRFDERLVLQFVRAILPDGNSARLDAYAIDPDTTEASVASKVDTHFFSRWGGLIAAAFLEGIGEAKRYSGASSVTNSFGTTDEMVWGDYSFWQTVTPKTELDIPMPYASALQTAMSEAALDPEKFSEQLGAHATEIVNDDFTSGHTRITSTPTWILAGIRFPSCDFTAVELKHALALAKKARSGDKAATDEVITIITKEILEGAGEEI